MRDTESTLLTRLLTQIRSEFDTLRWKSRRIEAFLVHRATNAEAEGVKGFPQPTGKFFAMGGAGHREFRQVVDENGNYRLRDDPIVDVHGKPIVNSAGTAYDVVMPAFRSVFFTGDNDHFGQLSTIAKRAGAAAAAGDFKVARILDGWRFSTTSDLWWALVFELAWTGTHPLLTADRRIWLPSESPNTYVPYDRETLKALSASEFGPASAIPVAWLQHLPEAWISELDDVVVASIDTLDSLIAELSTSDQAPPTSQSDEEQLADESAVDLDMQIRRRFKVALSFPGEHRQVVDKVAKALREVFREHLFYDLDHEAELAGPNLDLKLQRIYREDSDLVVVFVCGKYNEKEWCGIEWRAVRDLMKAKKRPDEDVMFLKLDDGDVEGLLSIDGYIDIVKKKPQDIANLILRRWSASR
jgi:hypothetical protein